MKTIGEMWQLQTGQLLRALIPIVTASDFSTGEVMVVVVRLPTVSSSKPWLCSSEAFPLGETCGK